MKSTTTFFNDISDSVKKLLVAQINIREITSNEVSPDYFKEFTVNDFISFDKYVKVYGKTLDNFKLSINEGNDFFIKLTLNLMIRSFDNIVELTVKYKHILTESDKLMLSSNLEIYNEQKKEIEKILSNENFSEV